MWYGRIQDLNIWKADSRSDRQLAGSMRKEVSYVNETVTFYMGQQFLETDINALNLSVRSYNCLRRAGWNTVGEILSHIDSWQDLMQVRNLGRTSAVEIMNHLRAYQVALLTGSDRAILQS